MASNCDLWELQPDSKKCTIYLVAFKFPLCLFSAPVMFITVITAQFKLCKIQVKKWSNERNQREEN